MASPDPALTGTLSGFLAGDGVTATYSRTAGETVAGSPYTISATLSPAGVLGNYSITYNTANFTITPAGLTITATARTKVYGALYTPDTTPPSVDFSVTGLLNSDSVSSITLTCAGYAAAALPSATPYPVVPSAAMGTGLGNYTISYVNGTLAIHYGSCGGSDPGDVILPPINADGTSVYSRKTGKTIPVKFKVCDAAGNSISDPNVVFPTGQSCGGVTLTGVRRGTVDNVNENADTDIPGVCFTYSGDHWQFNLATTNLNAGDTDTFQIALKDGSFITLTVGIK